LRLKGGRIMKNKFVFVFTFIIVLVFKTQAGAQFNPEEVAEREKWEEFLKTADIVGQRQIGRGQAVALPWILTLEKDGISRQALWKNPLGRVNGFLESWKWEIAAYRIDKFIGLNMVPPTVEKEFQGNRGSCQLWVTVEMDLRKKDREKIKTPPDKIYSWNRAIYLQRAFDNLVANIDRTQGNILITKDWRMILIDHSRSFGTYKRVTTELIYTEKHRDGPKIMKQLPRIFVEKIKDMNFEKISDVVGVYLTIEEIEAVLIRRDLILVEINRLIKKFGEDSVLY